MHCFVQKRIVCANCEDISNIFDVYRIAFFDGDIQNDVALPKVICPAALDARKHQAVRYLGSIFHQNEEMLIARRYQPE